jgi:alpha/beta hydrolase fold
MIGRRLERDTQMITCFHDTAPGQKTKRMAFVKLPAMGIGADEFGERAMVAVMHGRGLAVAIVVAQPVFELFVNGTVADALHEVVVGPATAEGYSQIWFLGISRGGTGALLYASRYPDHAESLVLLAPVEAEDGGHDWDSWLAYGTVLEASPVEISCVRDV